MIFGIIIITIFFPFLLLILLKSPKHLCWICSYNLSFRKIKRNSIFLYLGMNKLEQEEIKQLFVIAQIGI